MRLINIIPAVDTEAIGNYMNNDLPLKIRKEISLALELLPLERAYIGEIFVSGIDYVKVHHVKTGSIVIVEKDAAVPEGSVFVDNNMKIYQYVRTRQDARRVSFSIEADKYTYKVTDNTENAWGVIRLVISR